MIGFRSSSRPGPASRFPCSAIPNPERHGHPVQVVTDDPAWWDAFARKQPDSSWFRWALTPRSFDRVVSGNDYGLSLQFREQISPPPDRTESFHSAAGGRPRPLPAEQSSDAHVSHRPAVHRRTGRCDGAVSNPRGANVVRHYTLNEDDHDRNKGTSNLPFDGQVGYVAVDCDRAGPHVRLLEARAIASADPTNLGYLCASSFSTGFPGHVRRFNQAYLAVPALPSTIVAQAASDSEVVVREIKTPRHGTYYMVVNTGMRSKPHVTVHLPVRGKVRDLVEHRELEGSLLHLALDSAELRSYHVPPGP